MHDGEQAIDRNRRKMFTRVSSVAHDPCTNTDEVVRKSCAGNHNESSSGSIPTEKRSSLITRFSIFSHMQTSDDNEKAREKRERERRKEKYK